MVYFEFMRRLFESRDGAAYTSTLVGPCALPKLIPLYASPRDQQETLPVMVQVPSRVSNHDQHRFPSYSLPWFP